MIAESAPEIDMQIKAISVLMLADSMRRGGKERRLIELLKGLKNEPGISLDLVIFSDEIEYPEVLKLGYSVHLLPRRPKKDPRVFLRLHSLVRRLQPDLIHSWGTMATIYAIPAAKMLNIPLINGNVADAPRKMGFLDTRWRRAKLSFIFSDYILSNSRAGLKSYSAPLHKSQCIYNGFDPKRIQHLEDPQIIRRKLGIQTEIVVGMIGAFHDRKDYVTYIEAAIQLLNEGHDATFLAIGGGPNLEKCRNLVPDSYRKQILLPGQIAEVESIINIFNVGVLCTNESVHGEGVSNAILEYMALGKPVIATAGGGTPEIVVPGETGYLIDAGDSDQLVHYLRSLLVDPTIGSDMGNAGKQRIIDHFSLDRMRKDFINLYQSLANG